MMGGHLQDTSASEWRLVAGYCEHGSEPSVSIKCREFLQFLINFWLH
jgi:hypothetical protein